VEEEAGYLIGFNALQTPCYALSYGWAPTENIPGGDS